MINIDIVLVFQAVNFILLLFLLNHFLYKPIRKILADRDLEISLSRERTLSVDQEVKERMAEYENKLKAVKSDALEKRNQLISEARIEESRILDDARHEASEGIARIQALVQKEATGAQEFLRGQADSLSKDICEKVLGRRLS